MEKQVEDAIPHLKVGSAYLFEHIRKGPFVGVFLGASPTKEGDPQDTVWLEVDVFTDDGSGQERLANGFIRDELGRKTHPPVSKKLIRPSLLRSITTPSVERQKELVNQFSNIRAKAAEVAAQAGIEPVLPTLSLPTDKALRRLGGNEEEKKPGLLRRIFGKKEE